MARNAQKINSTHALGAEQGITLQILIAGDYVQHLVSEFIFTYTRRLRDLMAQHLIIFLGEIPAECISWARKRLIRQGQPHVYFDGYSTTYANGVLPVWA